MSNFIKPIHTIHEQQELTIQADLSGLLFYIPKSDGIFCKVVVSLRIIPTFALDLHITTYFLFAAARLWESIQ